MSPAKKKSCALRKTKKHPNVYTKNELQQLARKKGATSKEVRAMKKKELCEYLGFFWAVPSPKKPKGKILFLDTRPCNVLRSKLRPTAFTKNELVDLAIKNLSYSKTTATKLNKSELCKLLKKKVPLPKKEKGCISRSKLKLQKYQKLVVEYLLTHRGVIAAHSVGAGKTLTAVTASQCILDEHPDWRVIVVTPTSLQENFKKEMVAYGVDPKDKRYEFLTFEMFARKYDNKSSKCAKTFLIIDEAHNFRTNIKLVQKMDGRPPRANIAIQCAKHAEKVLLLTATPVYNNPMDVANLVAMLKGRKQLSAKEFTELLEGPSSKFNRYFECLFSFYKIPKTKDYPTVSEKEIKMIMDPEYYKQYRKVEKQISHFFSGGNPWRFLTGVRQATNALDPCQKCIWAVNKIKEGEKTVLYSNFKTYGVKKIQNMLKDSDIKYTEIIGSTNRSKRAEAVNEFNNSVFDVLFITKAGSEGIDLKGVRNVILLESGWNRPGEEQVIGRAVRYQSHTHLPPNEQHVNVYHLMIIKPVGSKEDSNDPKYRSSADEILKKLVKKKEEKNKLFIDRIDKLSTERLKKCKK